MKQPARLSVDRYVLETLMPDLVGHDRRASSFLVYLALWARTGGRTKRTARLSLRALAEETGLSRRGVQEGLHNLVRRKLVSTKRASITAVPEYAVTRPWLRS
jgi:Bacterial regulatory proteins, gntR family